MKANWLSAILTGILLITSFQARSADVKESLIIRDAGGLLVCKDCDGNEIQLNKGPQRVIVCYASFIELWQLAGGKTLAMVDTVNKSNLPEAVRDIPTVGAFVNPNLEKMLSLKPDLVLLCGKIEKHRAVRDMLKEQNIQSILLDYENYNDFLRLLELFSKLNGKEIKEIPEAAKVVSQVNGITAKAANLKGPKFISLFASAKELSAETSSANTACMASMLGGVNVTEAAGLKVRKGVGSVKFSMERMIMENPDIILFTTMGDAREIQERMKNEIMSDPAWQGMRAVKEGKVFFLPNALFLYKPNEHFPSAFRHLAKILYPEETW